MVKINIINRDGEAASIDAATDQTLMEALRDEDVEGIEAICGGSCACATCHVYVEENWFAKLSAPDEGELDLIEDLDVRQNNSRLCCQIEVTDDLDGISLTIPPEE